jgi:hypothetical protein
MLTWAKGTHFNDAVVICLHTGGGAGVEFL